MEPKVLVVEDEPKVAALIKEGLESCGMAVSVLGNGETAYHNLLDTVYDLVVLDVNLPGMTGFQLCQRLRQEGNGVPVVMLTAYGTTADKLEGFESGADDYIVKPFDFQELLARIRAVLKRAAARKEPAGDVLRLADLEMKTNSHEVTRSGQPIKLTAKEFALLELLLRNRGRVVSRPEIALKAWGLNFDRGTNFIDVYINSLRKKLDKDYPVKLIHTVTGVGFILKAGND